MTDTNVSLFDDLCNMLEQSEPDFLRRAVAMLFQQIMDADVTQRVGATRHQRSGCGGTIAMDSVDASSTRASARLSCRFQNCVQRPIFRPS